MGKKQSNLFNRIFVLCCFAVLGFLMVYRLNHSSLWYDEWIEFYYSQNSLTDGTMYRSIISTFQPPLYNVLMHGWLMVSHSLTWFRLFNVIPGFLTGLFVYASAADLTGSRGMGGFAVLILSVSYQWVYMVQEASEYVLMMLFVSASVYAYLKAEERPSFKRTAGLALAAAGAAYSQYGCVFVVMPLLLLHLFRTLQRKDRAQIRNVALIYTLSLVFLAFPLYHWFAGIQIGNHKITGASATGDPLRLADLVCKFGTMVVYLIRTPDVTETSLTMGIGAVILLTALIVLIRERKTAKADFVLTVLFALLLHYALVQKHIYAMVHAGMSAGYYCRYSVFYLPVLPVLLMLELSVVGKLIGHRPVLKCVLPAILSAVIAIGSLPGILANWHKSYDREMAFTWLANDGNNQYTVLYGTAENSFYYFVRDQHIEANQVLNRCWMQVDTERLPSQFWLWYSNYGADRSISFAEDYEKLTGELKEKGYQGTVKMDGGDMGQLIFYQR